MSPWLALAIIVAVGWLIHAQRLQEHLNSCHREIRKVKEAQGHLESSLSRRGRRLDVLLSTVNEAVMRVDRLGRVMAANAQARDLFRMDDAPKLPQSMLLFYRDPEWQRAFAQGLKGLPEAAALPDIRVAGRTLTPRLAPLGKSQALLLCLDVTEMRKLEKQRKTFLTNLMHDLKTPLTSILGYARSIESFDDDEELRRESARVIAEESKYVNELLESLLTLDKIDCSKPPANAACEAEAVAREAAVYLADRTQARELKIDWQCDQSLRKVAIMGEDLHRIIVNILANAIRFSPNGGVIRLSMAERGGMCELAITDEGEGVPESELPKLTERFYRVDRSRGRSGDSGHGLGLSIVNELVEKYHGSLELENGIEKGLVVTIQLPLVRR